MDRPVLGLYDSLLTQRVAEQFEQWRAQQVQAEIAAVAPTEVAHLLGRFIGAAATRALSSVRTPEEQVALANDVLQRLADDDQIADGPERLLSLVTAGPTARPLDRPLTALSEAALLTNAKEDPRLAHEIAAELASVDRVDLLCAFVKWSGLRVLEQQFADLRRRGVPLRIVTTTYMGATERRALDRLVEDYGAEVRISYEQNSTRLHAKAWLLHRVTGFDTAYIGSSNLSRAAMLDGLEWNVRISAVTTPRLIDKFRGTFDSYWARPEFERYLPERDRDRLDEALSRATGSDRRVFDVPALVPHPFAHQRQMLQDLDLQRTAFERHRNLLVAATGTGKTVTAAFDYRNLEQRLGRRPSLLFIAHRREILDQAWRTYRQVLADPGFGELHHGDRKATAWRHVFASVQSLSRRIEEFDPAQFDVVVIDEFHHAHAASYRRIIDRLQPVELLGLTATPERADGKWVQDEFFDRRIASELRLWDALDADLLCPFHYFGIDDDTDLTGIAWTRGAYDQTELDALLTGDDDRARIVFNAVRDKVSDLVSVRGLGFCVSVRHARYMADFFSRAGVPSLAVDGSTPAEERRAALTSLRDGTVTFLFAVDIFNEGLDLPDVNTLLLLRPTESSTLFLQQLGRGLRRTHDKDVLTVLDFVGQHRKEYHFENRFQALTGFARKRLEHQVEQDFPQLPQGCQVILDRISKERLLGALKERLATSVTVLAREVRSAAELTMARFLEDSGRSISDIYRSNHYWTDLLRRAGRLDDQPSPIETTLGRRMRAFLHVDDRRRATAYRRLLDPACPRYDELPAVDQAFARMLFFSLWRDGGGHTSYDSGLRELRTDAHLTSELAQIVEYGAERPRRVSTALSGALGHLALDVHASYSADEVLAALGWASLGGSVPARMREGVAWSPATQCDALFVTLHKNEREFSPQTMYRDYALAPTLFHWESQNRTSATSATGLRYQNHQVEGSHVLLFTREMTSTEAGHPEPYVFHGNVQYVEHEGSRPMAVTWRLDTPMSEELFQRAAIAA